MTSDPTIEQFEEERRRVLHTALEGFNRVLFSYEQLLVDHYDAQRKYLNEFRDALWAAGGDTAGVLEQMQVHGKYAQEMYDVFLKTAQDNAAAMQVVLVKVLGRLQ